VATYPFENQGLNWPLKAELPETPIDPTLNTNTLVRIQSSLDQRNDDAQVDRLQKRHDRFVRYHRDSCTSSGNEIRRCSRSGVQNRGCGPGFVEWRASEA
jgi:hypothetical protein